MRLVHLVCSDGAEEIYVEVIDLRWTLNAIGRVSVSRDVERLVCILRVIEVVRDRQLVRRGQIPIDLRQKSVIIDLMFHRQTLVLSSGRLNKVDEGKPLTVRTAVN